MEKQTPNNSEYIEHHPEAIQDKDLAHEVARAGHIDRSLAASARRAVALLDGEVSAEERAAKSGVYKESEELVRELVKDLSTDGINRGRDHGEGPRHDQVPEFDDLDEQDRKIVMQHLKLGVDNYHDRTANAKENEVLASMTQKPWPSGRPGKK